MCAARKRETFKMLSGSNSDDGARYEFLMCSYVALKLSQDEATQPDSKIDYKLSTNSDVFGKFDDVIVEITEENVTETWAAQLKHKANQKPITKNELCGVKGDFSINMYFEDYKKRQNLLTAIKSVLFTNKNLEAGKSFKLDGKPYTLTPIKSNKTCPLDTSNDCSVYQFDLTLQTGQQVKNPDEIDEYKTFLDNFYICASQKNADEIEKEVSNLFTEVYGSDRVDKYKTYFETWWRERPANMMKPKLYKEDIEIEIAKMVLEPSIIPTNANVSCPKADILKTIISKFDITLIEDTCGDDLVGHLSKICDSDWDISDIPTAISVHKSNIESVCKSVNILSAHQFQNFVLLGECVNLCKFNNCKVFGKLIDLNNKDYMDVTTNFYCVVQGRKLSPLHEILESNSKLKGYFTLSHLLNMMDEKKPFVIGDATVELPKNYIERSLPKHIFSCDLITTLGDSEVLVISGCKKNEREKIENLKNSRTQVIDIKNRDYVIEPKRDPLIFVSEKKVSTSKLSEICSKIDEKRSVLNFEFLENSLNLLSTHGTSSKLMKFREKNTDKTIRDLEILSNFMSDTNILVADPGMGKTICADLIKQICPFDAWPVKINLREKLELFKNFTSVQDLLEKVVFTDAQSILAKYFRDYYYAERKIMLVWDGMDEIGSEQNIDLVIDIIKKISCETHHYQWIMSRYHLKEKLESFFGIESITLIEAAENEQRKYIKGRLQEVYGEDIQKVTDDIYESIAKSNLKDMLGIPLLLNMFTTICSNIDYYKRIRENEMTLTQIYGMFVDAKFDEHFSSKIGNRENTLVQSFICQRKVDHLPNYAEAALVTCFDNHFLKQLSINCDEFIQKIKQSGDIIGLITIITESGTPIFLHKTFAEYFAAFYLAKNYKQIDKKKLKQLFQPEHRNIRLLFDMHLSKNHPAHLAVLAMNLDKLKEIAENKEDRHLWEDDEGGRNVLHLASSYGTERRPLEQLNCWDARSYQEYCRMKPREVKVFDSTPLHSFEAENKVYEEIIEYLVSVANQKQRTINYKDKVYELNCVEYADASFSLYAVETLLKISKVEENYRPYLCDHKDIETLVTYSIVLSYQNLISVFENIPYFELCQHCDAFWDNNYDGSLHEEANVKNVNEMYSILLLIIEFGGTEVFEKALKHNLFENWMINRTFYDQSSEFRKRSDNFHSQKVNALYWAVKKGNPDIFNLLIQHDVDLNQTYGVPRFSILHIAVIFSKKNMVEHIADKENADIDILNLYQQTPLMVACKVGDSDIYNYLIEKGAKTYVRNSEGQNLLHISCEAGHFIIVQDLVENKKIDLESIDFNGKTPLLTAAQKSHFGIVQYLLKKGSNLKVQDKINKNVLHYACENGFLTFIQSLTKEQIIQLDTPDKNGDNLLLTAAKRMRFDIVKYLLENGSDLEVQDEMRRNVLHYACLHGSLTFIQSLTKEQIIQLDTPDKNDDNLLLTAAKIMRFDIVKYLLENGSNLEFQDEMRRNVLHYACMKGSLTFIQSLTKKQLIQLDTPDKNGNNPLLTAAKTKHFDIVKYLLENGSNLELQNELRRNVLHYACLHGSLTFIQSLTKEQLIQLDTPDKNGNNPLLTAAKGMHFDIVKYLLGNGSNLEFQDEMRRNVLHYACLHGSLTFVQSLTKEQLIQLDTPDKNGDNPSLKAAEIIRFDIVKNLLENGCNLEAQDGMRRNVLHYACENGFLTFIKSLTKEQLIKLDTPDKIGYNPSLTAAYSKHFDIVKYLLENGSNLEVQNERRRNVLHYACWRGSLTFIQSLTKEQLIQLDTPDKNGDNPLLTAAEGIHFDIVEYLLENGSNLEVQNEMRRNVLHYACMKGSLTFIQSLTKKQLIQLDTPDKNGHNPLLTAAKTKHFDIVKYLLENGSNLELQNQSLTKEQLIQLDTPDSYGGNPLLTAAEAMHFDIVKILLENGSKLKVQDEMGRNGLHYACEKGSLTFILSFTKEQLIQFDTPDKNGNNPSLTAAKRMHFDIVKYLLENGSNMEAQNEMRRNVLHYACENGFLTFIKSLTKEQLIKLDTPDKIGNNPSLTAAYSKHFDIVKYLLENGSNLEVQNERRRNVLHYACLRGSLTFIQSLTKKQLIQLDTPDKNGDNPLLTAARELHYDIVRYLLENGSNLEVQDEMRKNVLHYACENGSLTFIKSLTKEQLIQLDTPDNRGDNPLSIAINIGHSNVVKYLLKDVGT